MPYQPIPELIIEHDGPVAIVTMNNPELRNAFSDDMHVGMQEVWNHLDHDRSVSSIVLTGAGSAFSAGGNIPGFIRSYEDPIFRREQMRGAQRLLNMMLECSKPMIAAVNGPAVGLGCSVAVSCDIVFMAEETFMADTHVSIGLVAGDGGAAQWPFFMSILKAKYYLLTGERIPAAECVNLGLANKTVAGGKVVEEAVALGHRLAALPQQAVQETKKAMNIHLQQAAMTVGAYAIAAEMESFGTDDIAKTVAKFKKM
jgi:enoyl-CoA hydratase